MKLVGIFNLGNTCYINSVLQCFINDSDFQSKINTFKENSEVLKEIVNFLLSNHELVIRKFNILEFINSFTNKHKSFTRFQQHDAHEFLLNFLDLFDSSEYYGKTKLQITCCRCKRSKDVIEDFTTINLNVPEVKNNKDYSDLTDLFINYLKKEKHDDPNNLYFCDFCKCNTVSEKKIILWKLPKKLIIVLKRYSDNGSKIHTDVEFSIKDLLIKETESGIVNNYSLTSVINHIGDTNYGHYFCSIKKENKWFLIDDETLSLSSKIDNNNNKSYILFYSIN